MLCASISGAAAGTTAAELTTVQIPLIFDVLSPYALTSANTRTKTQEQRQNANNIANRTQMLTH